MVGINRAFVLVVFICISLGMAYAQDAPKTHPKHPIKKENKCTTWVSNLTTDDVHARDICFSVTIVGHGDMHELHEWEERKKTDEFWRFSIDIVDIQNKTSRHFGAAYYLYEENSELKQYHCSVRDDEDVKALIFDKTHNSWEILLMQNDQWKVLSSYPGCHYLNAFGIKAKDNSSFNY